MLASGTLGCCDDGGSKEWCISLRLKPRLTHKLALMPTSSAWPVYLWIALKMGHLLYFSSVDHSFWIKKTTHSVFVETQSSEALLKSLEAFWRALHGSWVSILFFRTLMSFHSTYLLQSLSLTVRCWFLYPELFLHLPLRRVIEVHTSPLLSAALELEAQPFQVNIYQSQQNKEWVLACKLQLSEVFEKLCKITRSIPPLPFYFPCLYTHCQKNETPSYSSSWVYSWCLKAESRCATCAAFSWAVH